jgi:BirA family biotin operon repressor/biotin-[acetyl-CoA-carboxylase] ligase
MVIETVAETGSTNADLLARAAGGAPEGLWLRAERQSGGRGRLGRDWQSPLGNLYASTIVRLRAGDPEPASLALVASVAAHEVAQAWMDMGAGASVRLAIKWPNDLMAGPAKLAGILLEKTDDAIVAGFGLNLAHAPDLPDRATASFAALGLSAPDPATFLADLAAAFARWLQRWRGEGLEPVRQSWLAAAHPIGTPLTAAGEQGLFDGLEPDGALRLARPDGGTTIVRAGDVFLL